MSMKDRMAWRTNEVQWSGIRVDWAAGAAGPAANVLAAGLAPRSSGHTVLWM